MTPNHYDSDLNFSGNTDSTEVKFPRVEWRPYLATAPSRTPIVHYGNRRHPLLLTYNVNEKPSTAVAVAHPSDYPYGKIL